MSVGDVNSNERGSGARYNDGKAQVQYIPARVISDYYWWRFEAHDVAGPKRAALDVLTSIAGFEEGDESAVYAALEVIGFAARWNDAGAQFAFGAKKYAAWNWAKGMQWSVPCACIKRHCIAILEGEEIDKESGVSHLGAVGCNLIMLSHFLVHYRAGDDRPPPECFDDARQESDAALLGRYMEDQRASREGRSEYQPQMNACAEGETLVDLVGDGR